ncbi:MAG: chemotaxis protein CheW [Micromonosporaceae bacterium]|nr:chemotaxis protein CheW [Micromonosporaceae bacterium]
MDELGDIVQEFLVESHENLDQLDRDLVALEQTPGSRALLSSIFRTIHTIKGTSGFLAFNRLERVTHVGESLLARLRDGAQVMTPEATNALLRMVDIVRTLLASIEANGADGGGDIESVIQHVQSCIENPVVSKATSKEAALPEPQTPAEKAAAAEATPQDTAAAEATPQETPPPGPTREEAGPAGKPVPAQQRPALATQPSPDQAKATEEETQPPATTEQAIMKQQATAGTPEQQPGAAKAGGDSAAEEAAALRASQEHHLEELFGITGGRRSVAESSIRVDVDLLDALMRQVGELVLTRNQLVRAITETADAGMTRTAQRLNLITSELQESVMKTRMQAIEHLWAKLPRVVRDLSAACGKRVRLAMEGRETELDRSLLEAVKDPLTHLVRNAVDHGIEDPDVRVAAGKPAEGVLTLRAYHEGGHVLVEVADNGAGIDPDAVAEAAITRGLITRDQAGHMDRREMLNLLFKPGFSTAKTVTKVSGRGVGMDVVKTNIERIGGAVDVESTVGVGTTWRLTIPLTLAIIQALTVECGNQRYVIPQVAVQELVFLDGQSGRVIENAMGAPVYRLRGNLLPLVRLDQTLGLPEAKTSDRDVYVAVLQAEGRRFGLVVDRVLNTEEVVVKPLTARFKDIGVYAGACILGDGRVALILDVTLLARRSHLAAGGGETAEAEAESAVQASASAVDRLLIAGVGGHRVAIPLDMVTRLEEFAVDKIERSGSREVVQYREQILPVVRLSHLLGSYGDLEQVDPVPVVVYTERGRSVALAVDNILDIVEEELGIRRDFGDDGLLGSAVIQQRVTELLDVRRAISAADPMFDTDESSYGPYDDFEQADGSERQKESAKVVMTK